MKCARTACDQEATSGPHPDLPVGCAPSTGQRYCEKCRRIINRFAGRELIPFQPHRFIKLPKDFGADTNIRAANCPFVLTETTANCDLKPGDVVIGEGDCFGFDHGLQCPRTVRMVLFGFHTPHGYACCIDRDGEWWNVPPETLEKR